MKSRVTEVHVVAIEIASKGLSLSGLVLAE